MHGGLFNSDDVTLDDIKKIDRNRQPPDDGERVSVCQMYIRMVSFRGCICLQL